MQRRIIILGAAGRDFHNFNVCFRGEAEQRVVAFTAAQIPDIAGRRYPPELAGPGYPNGIPVIPEAELEKWIVEKQVNLVVFSYSDVSHNQVMNLASRSVARGADSLLLGAERAMLKSRLPVISVCAARTGSGKSPVVRRVARILMDLGRRRVIIRHPMPYGDLIRRRVQEEIRLGTILIDTAGEKVGQVNGLSVIEVGQFAFGQPSRITARMRLGKGEVVDIEREVELSGQIHSKGVLILSGFLGARYAIDRPLSLSASLVFEQSYGPVEGDSASPRPASFAA